MSASEPEILSMEEVRRLARVAWVSATTLYGPDRSEILGKPGEVVRGLCATVEHWHREAKESLEANARCATAKEHAETKAQELGLERDRLRALAARMREAVDRCQFLLDTLRQDNKGRPPYTHVQSRAGTMVDVRPLREELGQLLSDPDGQNAAEEFAKLREDAEKWRALMAEAAEHLKEPAHAARIAKMEKEIEAHDEEVRLLREVERTQPFARPPGASLIAYSEAHQEAWKALAAFRARHKGDPT